MGLRSFGIGAGPLLLRALVLVAAPSGAPLPGIPRRRGRGRTGEPSGGLRPVLAQSHACAGWPRGGDRRERQFLGPLSEGDHVVANPAVPGKAVPPPLVDAGGE